MHVMNNSFLTDHPLTRNSLSHDSSLYPDHRSFSSIVIILACCIVWWYLNRQMMVMHMEIVPKRLVPSGYI